jgi:hypothetical protein
MKLKILIFIVLSVMFVQASIPTDWYYGRRINFIDAQSVALAGINLFKPSVYFNNPLGKELGKPQLGFSYNMGFLQERRTVEVYDQFDNTVGEYAIAENLFTRGNIGNISFLLPLKFLNVSASLRPQYTFDYYFYREFRDNFYAKVGEEELKVTGAVYNASAMVGHEFLNKFGVGAGFNYYFGSRKYTYHDSIINGTHISAETTGTPSGIGFTVGFSAMPIDRLLINLVYQSRTKLSKWENDLSMKYPESYRLEASYLAAGDIPTKVGVSFQYTNWKVFQSIYDTPLEIGLGVEHMMLNTVALRYGFRFEPSFVPPIVHQGLISLGFGFMAGNVKIDIGMDIKRRILGSENLVFSNDNTLKVYQNTGEVLIGALIPIEKLW